MGFGSGTIRRRQWYYIYLPEFPFGTEVEVYSRPPSLKEAFRSFPKDRKNGYLEEEAAVFGGEGPPR